MPQKPQPKKLIVILGQTASGKSALALNLAKLYDGEIICADSWTVYKGFDIGTAKPSKVEREQITHHMLDVASPAVGFSAAVFKKQVINIISGINNRKIIPILVGGTGLYIDSIIFDYNFLPASDPKLRTKLNGLSIPELLEILDKQSINTEGIDVRNKRRLIRLIESGGVRPTKSKLRPNTLIIGCQVSAEALKERLELRVDEMLKSGLEQEVMGLAKKYGWDVEPMKGIGYREFQDYFEGDKSLEQVRLDIIGSSMQLAKKQTTWFKRNKYVHWVNNTSEAKRLVDDFLNKSR